MLKHLLLVLLAIVIFLLTIAFGLPATPATGQDDPAPTYAIFLPVIQIAAGSQHTCALTEAGAVWCWGFNNAGQLGLGDDLDHTLPEAVIGLPVPIIQITAGQYHTCAIGTNRRIYCWGNNPYGQLGDGTQDQHFTPIRVGGLPQAVQVAAGWGHTCAIDVQTRVWCWGENLNGAFGNDTQDSSLVPVRSWMNDASFIAAGLQTTCAIKISNQGVYCWGRNWTGQVGDGSVTSRFHPVRVVGVRAIMVSMGRDHTCAATRAGGVACWGLNDHGQLGDGTTDNSSWAVGPHFPEAVGTWAVSAANYGSCAQSSGGEVWCWGDNAEGDTGDGTNDTPRLTPVATVGGAFAWPRATAFARLVTSTLPLGIQRSWAFYAGSDQVGGSQSRNVRHRVRR